MPSATAAVAERRSAGPGGAHGPRPGWLRGAAMVAMAILLAGLPATARPAGPERPTVTATWEGVPARTVCRRLTEIVGCPVILDRRVDPDTPVTVAVEEAPLVDVLGRVAAALGGRCAVLRSAILVVPADAAPVLVAAEGERQRAIAALAPSARRIAAGRAPWSWDDGARPVDLLAALAEGAGIELVGLEGIPHDHLAAASLPPLPLAERLDLLLGQFDRRIDWSVVTQGPATPRLTVAPLPARIGDDGALVVVSAGGPPGPRGVRPPRSAAPPPAGTTTWTLEVAAPLEQLLSTVASRLDLDLDLDREGLRRRGIAAAEIVRLSVKDVDRDTLLDRIVGPLDLQWSIDGRILRVGPKGGSAGN